MSFGSHRARKRFGQHWLADEVVLERIVAAARLEAGERVLEVGPGRGALTERLLTSAVAAVHAVELDRDLVVGLRQRFGADPRFHLIEGDVLSVPLIPAGEPPADKVVANIPYNITGPLLERLVGRLDRPAEHAYRCLVLLVQQEVGERMRALPGSGSFSALSVRVQLLARCRSVCVVPPRCFRPPPKVNSEVVLLEPLPAAELPPPELAGTAERLVRRCFAARRKMLRNSLAPLLPPDLAEALAAEDEPAEPGSALVEPAPEPTDDDAAFVAAVRARRRSGSRPVVTSTPEPRPRTARRPVATSGSDVLPDGGRSLPVALMTAVIFAAIAILVFLLGRGPTTLLVAFVVGACGFELCAALHEKGLRPASLLVTAACVLFPIATYHYTDHGGFEAFPVFVTVVTLGSLLWFLWRLGPGRPVVGVAASVLAFVYVGGLGGYAGLLLQRPHGVGLMLGTLISVVAYDVVGFFAGSQFGSTPIAPRVSPNKTVEGTLAGVVAAAVSAAVAFHFIGVWSHKSLLVHIAIGLAFGIAALLGDLCESLLKRDLGVKDFGTLLPGHGGFLDRFDGLLFALPVAFYLVEYFKLF
jgi:16S rRNA (adenine1518-N6/adenine1519-N6)-dimethyltransferase